MAKRKLSLQERNSIRKEIQQLISQKKKQADILRAMAKKYGIKPITARWYYQSVVGTAKGAFSRKSRVLRRAVGHRASNQPANGTSLRLINQVQSIADRNFKRVLEVKRLIPKWQVYVKKEAALRKLENRVKTNLRAISTKASELHRKIRALTSS